MYKPKQIKSGCGGQGRVLTEVGGFGGFFEENINIYSLIIKVDWLFCEMKNCFKTLGKLS